MEQQDIISSGLLELYAVGVATPEETLEVERWRDMYPEAASELLRIEDAMKIYAMANGVMPPGDLRQKILSELPFQRPGNTKVFSISPVRRALAAVAIIVLIGSVLLNITLYAKYVRAEKLFASSQKQFNDQRADYVNIQRDMYVVQNKHSEPVALRGLEAAPDAAAKIFWMKNTGDVYIDPSNLPPAPDSMQYQLWAIVDGKPVDAGMIERDPSKKFRIQKMKSFGRAQAFAVTLETIGGQPEPKGKMYVMGEI